MASYKKTLNYQDPNGRHIRVYCALLNSPAYRVLGYASKALFFDLREKVMATNNGNIEAVLNTLKHKGWKSATTLATALYELQAMGFLVKTRGGGVEVGSKVCALYRFTDLPAPDHPKQGVTGGPATHDYRSFQSLREAEEALIAGVQRLRQVSIDRKHQAAERKKRTIQNLDRHAQEYGATGEIYAPEIGAAPIPSLQKLEEAQAL